MAPSPTVLVADGSPFARAWAGRLLGEAGNRVVTAGDGPEALAGAGGGAADVLVLDEALPGLSGREIVRALRAQGGLAGVVLLTDLEDPEVEADALRSGVDQLVRTPCRGDVLVGAVHAAFRAGDERRVRAERERANEGELRAAAAMQAALLPRPPEVPPGWTLEHGFVPAREVGGDVFDMVPLDGGRLVLALADVSGKGAGAALAAAMLQTALRAGLARGDDPAAALSLAGRLLHDGLARAGRFLTATAVEVDLSTGALRYADAGHGHHLLIGAGGEERPLPCGGPPIGFLPEPCYPLGEERLEPGAALALFSDGLVEGEDDAAAGRARLREALRAGDAAAALAAAAPDLDDRTLLVARRAA